MTVTIELKPETERRIQERAQRRSKAIEAYLEDFIEENIVEESDKLEKERPFYETATKEEWLVEFHRWLDSHKDKNYPVLPDKAYSWENIYQRNLIACLLTLNPDDFKRFTEIKAIRPEDIL